MLTFPKFSNYIPHKPQPKQFVFLKLNCLEAFYGGAAGGGKSDTLLMAALQYVDVPGYNAILIRDTFKNLSMSDSLMDRADEWLSNTDAHWNGENKRWEFPSGATLSFGYLDSPRDHFNYQSAAFQFVGIDEVVNIREKQALYMFSRVRKKEPGSYIKDIKLLWQYSDITEKQLQEFYTQYKNLPLRFRCASNPPEQEQIVRGAWVKKRYVDANREKSIVFIPAKLEDNPHLDRTEYIQSLNKLDPVTRAQLLEGDWDIKVKGRMFDRGWFEVVDIAPADVIARVRYWDMASTEPNKENVDPDYTSGCKMSVTVAGIYYIESIIKFRKSPRYNEQIVRQTADIDGKEVAIWMEQEPGASGKSMVDHYRRHILPEFIFYGDKVSGSKRQRAMPLASQADAGNIKIVSGVWNNECIEEVELFPDGEHDDQVDSMSGAYDKLASVMNEPNIRFI